MGSFQPTQRPDRTGGAPNGFVPRDRCEGAPERVVPANRCDGGAPNGFVPRDRCEGGAPNGFVPPARFDDGAPNGFVPRDRCDGARRMGLFRQVSPTAGAAWLRFGDLHLLPCKRLHAVARRCVGMPGRGRCERRKGSENRAARSPYHPARTPARASTRVLRPGAGAVRRRERVGWAPPNSLLRRWAFA